MSSDQQFRDLLASSVDERLREMLADFGRARKQMEPLLPGITSALLAAGGLGGVLRDPGFARAVEFAASMTQFQRQLAEQVALERRFLPTLASHGWLVSPLAPADEPSHLDGLYKTGGIEAVETHLLNELDSEACNAIVDEVIRSRPAFARWSATFKKALDAQERGDHELALPIWLAALDGICADELGIPQAYSTITAKKKRKAIKTQLMPGNYAVHEPMLDAWLAVLLGFSIHNDAGPAVLNRHAVMHGRRPDMGTRKDALQCLVALQVLEFLLTLRDRATDRRS